MVFGSHPHSSQINGSQPHQDGLPLGRTVLRGAPSEESQTLVDLYRKWFDIIPARTDELVRESRKLRFQVYCLETGFEDQSRFPDGCEHDAYDDHAVCSLLVHKPSGLIAGTVRLILPSNESACLPAVQVSPDLANLPENQFPRATAGEISRFAISKQFRKRREDSLIPALYETAGSDGEQRVIPHITLGLMQAILRMSIENGISHLAILVEPALDRLIRKLGIRFEPVGPLIDHHGKRRVHVREIGALLDDSYARKPEIWEVLTNGGSLWPSPPDRA